MKIIVTGGAGFIASHIADAYIAAGHRVAVVDNLSTGRKKNLPPKAVFYKADIRSSGAIETIFKKERPDIVNHHAAMISVTESVRRPLAVFETNILGTANLAVAFGKHRKSKGSKFIFASTGGALYGEPKKIPADENTPINPLSPYGLSKHLAEQVIGHYAMSAQFPYLLLRYSNIYGPRQNPKGEAGVIAIFAGLMKQGIRPIIFGDGSKTRDYVFVGDIVQANVLALAKGKNTALNIGAGKEISDQEVFDAIAASLRFTQKPKYAPYRTGEVYRISLNAKKARRVLGWRPKTNFAKGASFTATTL